MYKITVAFLSGESVDWYGIPQFNKSNRYWEIHGVNKAITIVPDGTFITIEPLAKPNGIVEPVQSVQEVQEPNVPELQESVESVEQPKKVSRKKLPENGEF